MSTPMLVQASKVYTPIIFEAFQSEYERSMAACIKVLDGNKYVVAIGSLHGDLTFEDERLVIGDPLTKQLYALVECLKGREYCVDMD
jgi:zinc finger SWIM domain-containing protein 3